MHISILKPKTYFMHHQLCDLPTMYLCFAWISEQTAIISLYNINLSVFINEAESVYCGVQTGSSNKTVSSLKG